MSGGSYDYVSYKIDELSECIINQECDPRRASFCKLLKLVAKAAHEIEWVDSADCVAGDEYRAIDDVFAFLTASPDIIMKAHAFDGLKDQLVKYFLISGDGKQND